MEDIIEHATSPISDNDKVKKPRVKKEVIPLQKYYLEDPSIIEIGVDEVGRGPMFGRVYTAAVILPKDDSFNQNFLR